MRAALLQLPVCEVFGRAPTPTETWRPLGEALMADAAQDTSATGGAPAPAPPVASGVDGSGGQPQADVSASTQPAPSKAAV
eukprot:SAG31_NODE_9835_length_1222_cov_0.817453_2_plen_80_part_01